MPEKKQKKEPSECVVPEWMGQPLSTDVARERGSKGGIAAAKAKRERRTLRETMRLLLDEQFKFKNPVSAKPTNGDGYAMWCAQVVSGALKGDRKCLEYLRDIIGENPANRIVGADDEPLRRVEIEFVDKSIPETGAECDPKIVGENSPRVGDKNAH